LLEDNKRLFIIGVDIIQIKIYNDIVRILEIRYIQEMKKNLNSLSFLDFQGYSYFDKDGVLKVYKCVLDFQGYGYSQGKLVNELYHFQGSTIIDSANVLYMVDLDNDSI
jgi:hypothetical protein